MLPHIIRLMLVAAVNLALFAASAHAALTQIETTDTNVYFLYSAPNEIRVFDMETGDFTATLALDKVPTAFHIRDNTAFVGFHRELRAIALDGSSDLFVRNFSADVANLFTLGDFLFVVERGSEVTTLALNDYELVETRSPFYSGTGYVASTQESAYFFRSTGVSPSDIHRVLVDEAGVTVESDDSTYHGAYPSASRLFLNGSETLVVDNQGIMYTTDDLTYAGSLAGAVDDLVFFGNEPVVRRNTQLVKFDSAGIETGFASLNAAATFMAGSENTLYAFNTDVSPVTVEAVSLQAFSLPELTADFDPNTQSYEPELIVSDNSSNVYLIDADIPAVMVWSATEESYTRVWALSESPTWASYSLSHNRLYLGYPSGKITAIDVATENPIETHFLSLPGNVLGLVSAGDFLFAADGSGAWATHYSIDDTGSIIDSVDWRHTGSEYAWNPVTERIYHLRDGTSPNDVEWTELFQENGEFGADGDSPYHGGTISARTPLRVDAAGQYLLNGGGQILDSYSLEVLNAISNNISDGVWVDNDLITINQDNGNLQIWNHAFEPQSDYPLAQPFESRVFEMNGELLLVQQRNFGPVFSLFDLENLPDADNDGVHDLDDNCVHSENAEQTDTDGDRQGDACDDDDDNDRIPDYDELELGLNPLDASDAELDLDGDGYTNLIEYLTRALANDENSTPSAVSNMLIDFEDGTLQGLYAESGHWSAMAGQGIEDSFAATSPALSADGAYAAITFTGLFTDGVLSFSYKTPGDYPYRFNYGVNVGEQHINLYYNDDWEIRTVSVEAGFHDITFYMEEDYAYGESARFLIDNIRFEPDSDGDEVPDSIDNCPDTANRSQDDRDEDGLGDSCDNDPYNTDSQHDNDGYGDHKDNCPTVYNPDQADIDNDGLGDACDDTDDRPTDSDGDGEYDYYDNCPEIPNPMQEDMDRDGHGDPCDNDIDGDGLDNAVEDQYSFLDKFNEDDAGLDYDNDGVINYYEIQLGTNPAVAEEHQAVNLAGYFPLGNIDYVYSNGETLTLRATENANQYLLTDSYGWETLLSQTDNGVYSLEGGDPEYDYLVRMENYLAMPAELIPGVPLAMEVTFNYVSYDDRETFIRTITLIETGVFEFEGKQYPTVTLVFNNWWGYTIQTETYARGLGLVRYGTVTLESAEFEDEPAFGGDSRTVQGSSGGGGGGGSTGLSLLLMMCVLLRIRKSGKPRKSAIGTSRNSV